MKINVYEYPKSNISYVSYTERGIVTQTSIISDLFTIVDEDYYEKIMDQQLQSSDSPSLTSYETGKDLDLEKMFNHLGPELSFELGQQLIKLAMDDFYSAMGG